MAETSKSFWGKFKKQSLTPVYHSKLPTDLIEMFPDIDETILYNTYHLKCNNSISKTVDYLTRDQIGDNFQEEVPIDILIESLSNLDPSKSKRSGSKYNDVQELRPNYFKSTPTHILSHIFSFNGPMTWGKITRLNRECRLLSKGLLSKITQYDFSYFYHNYCQYHTKQRQERQRKVSGKRNKKRNRFNNNRYQNELSRIRNSRTMTDKIITIKDDDLKLISHINAFQYLKSLSLRSTYYTKWYSFRLILNKMNIKYLNLSSSLNLYDDDIGIIIETFTGLEVLDLSKCIEITDLSMTNIIEYGENTNNLHTIILNHTPMITKYGVKQLINYKKCITNLEWKGAKYGNITACFEKAKHMKLLNLSSNNALEQLILTLDNKHSSLDLNLANCVKLRFLDLKITHLTSLYLTQCIKLREVRISNTFNFREINAKSCKLLQLIAIPSNQVENVQISGCNALNLELLFHSDNFLINSLKNGKLKSLDISQIHHITNQDLDDLLQENTKNGNPLKALSVKECKLIPNDKINFIHKNFETPKIKSKRAQKRKQRIMDRKSRKYSC